MVINVDYTKAIEEMAEKIKNLIVENVILKTQLEAITDKLNNITNVNNENIQENEEQN